MQRAYAESMEALGLFHPVVRKWFLETFQRPTPAQALGWPPIARGEHTLILAPTGSGKTLAAFLWGLNRLFSAGDPDPPAVRLLYVSPLKALNNDIERNLRVPLTGIRQVAAREGVDWPALRVAVRTGDTSERQRREMLRRPPHILITTPESLFIMLTAGRSRELFRGLEAVIVDEVHALCDNKRGVHLSLTLERLVHGIGREVQRIGLSATQRPLEVVARFLGGQTWAEGGEDLLPRPVTIVDAGMRKEVDLQVICPVDDFRSLPEGTVWPEVSRELLGLIRQHRTTLVFTNTRAIAEKIAKRLNELGRREDGGLRTPVALAHHSSISREARLAIEEALKAGKLPALVATGTLELGIDIGSVDLVCQLQSPKSVTRGMQRVGRSGHLVSRASKGRLFPAFLDDLVELAVVARGIREGEVEETRIPRNCLDVLAQQIVAMVAADEWDAERLYRLIRQSYCYQDLPWELYADVLEMLSGRYPTGAFRELRPRLSWDRPSGRLFPMPGSRQLAVVNAGVIPERGSYPVELPDGTRIGELEEEFVFESRVGDAFLLGSQVWRIEEIRPDRVIASLAPGSLPRMPFWHGETYTRPFELSLKVGAFRRALSSRLDDPGCAEWLQEEYLLDRRGADALVSYFREQREATGVIPSDRTLVLELFADELGDRRLAVHAPFGGRVNALLNLVLARRLREAVGVEVQSIATDEAILFRLPSSDVPPPLDLLSGLSEEEVMEAVQRELVDTPLFAALFRQCAERALLLRRSPRRRTPLWLQRLRAGDLLEASRRLDRFPILLEAYRDALRDVLDLEGLLQVVRGIARGEIEVVVVERRTPSPFARSLWLPFAAVYLYQGDVPRAERQAQALAVNREVLEEVLGKRSTEGLLRSEAVEEVTGRLQHTARGWQARSAYDLLRILRSLGDLSEDEVAARSAGDAKGWIRELASSGLVRELHLPGVSGPRWIAREDEALYEQALVHNDEEARLRLLRRFLETRGPVEAREVAMRYGFSEGEAQALLERLEAQGTVARGSFLPARSGTQWCDREVLARIYRRTLAILRREIEPCPPVVYARFLTRWQHLHPSHRLSGREGVRRVLRQLQGVPLPLVVWLRDVLPARVREFDERWILDLTQTGEVAWVGRGSVDTVAFLFRGEGRVFLTDPPGEEALSPEARAVRDFLAASGASFFADLEEGTGLSHDALLGALVELASLGLVTNDSLEATEELGKFALLRTSSPEDPARWPIGTSRRPRGPRRLVRRRVMLRSGRWSLVHTPGLLGPARPVEEFAALLARQLLDRYGVVAREWHRREEGVLPWQAVRRELHRMELRGEVRRGYFVQGLSGVQYALPEAVEVLRQCRQEEDDLLLVNACDPANPYGAGGFPLPGAAARLPRVPSNYVVLLGGRAVLAAEAFGRRLSPLEGLDRDVLLRAVGALAGLLHRPRGPSRIEVEAWGGGSVAGSAAEVLREAGFYWDGARYIRSV